jgi:C_GCAxxG_C_C family probable redox protein
MSCGINGSGSFNIIKESIMDNAQEAVTLFDEGCNCSQAVLAAFCGSLGLDQKTALMLASGFGGGMGATGSTCGALTGAIMVLGLKYGSSDISNKTAKYEMYRKTRSLVEEFKLQTGSLYCRDLLGFDMSTEEGQLAAKQPEAFHDCPQFVRIAAEIIEEMLEQ